MKYILSAKAAKSEPTLETFVPRSVLMRSIESALLFSILFFWNNTAIGEVTVDNISVYTRKLGIAVPAGQYQVVEIGQVSPSRKFGAELHFAEGNLSAAIFDQSNLDLFRQGRRAFSPTFQENSKSPIILKGQSTRDGNYFLVIDNRRSFLFSKDVRILVIAEQAVPPEAVGILKKSLEEGYLALKNSFEFQDFNIHVNSCGMVNAFSNPDITLCDELLFNFIRANRTDGILAIFMHELGHTLLNLWGLPGYDNEDVADEFSAALLLSDDKNGNGTRAIRDAIWWFSTHDSRREAAQIISSGDRHSLSIQRIRNLEAILRNPDPVVRRWNKVFYDHFTKTELERVLKSPGPHDDVAVADKVLRSRFKEPSSSH